MKVGDRVALQLLFILFVDFGAFGRIRPAPLVELKSRENLID